MASERWRPMVKFLASAFGPFKGWLGNVITWVVPAAASGALAIRHPLWAAIVVLSLIAFLLLIAGFRLEGRRQDLETKLQAQKVNREFIDSLGRSLTLGRIELDTIESASEKYQKGIEEMKAARHIDEARFSELHTKVGEESHKWEFGVRQRLDNHLDYSYAARFEDDAGLTPAHPPSEIQDDYCVAQWQHHEMRLQRLHEIIKELQDKWN